jgi:hypothetical protein
MSIDDLISAWKADGTLSCVQHAIGSAPTVRRVLACKMVRDRLVDASGSGLESGRLQVARATIDLFIEGELIAVRVPPSTSARAQLACLSPWHDHVWEFRTRPDRRFRFGVRIFGMFAARDLFIAMCLEFKEELLLTETEYPRVIESCKRVWRILFTPYSSNLGDDVNDYLSKYNLV